MGGNVLTSQRVTDVVLKAFQAAAASQVLRLGHSNMLHNANPSSSRGICVSALRHATKPVLPYPHFDPDLDRRPHPKFQPEPFCSGGKVRGSHISLRAFSSHTSLGRQRPGQVLTCGTSPQGCMNNLTFGDEGMGYYETIAGGAGAGPYWHGRSGVHTHMTNTCARCHHDRTGVPSWFHVSSALQCLASHRAAGH